MARRFSGMPDEPPVVASARRTSFAVVLGVWGLLIATLPLYFTFLLFNLPDVLTILSNLRAIPGRTPFSDDPDPAPADPTVSAEPH